MTQKYYAHSKNKVNQKHLLVDHLESVGKLVRCFTQGLSWTEEAALAGQLHDLGKYGDLFQLRLQGKAEGIDHWSAGAWAAISKEYQAIAAALAIEGHHIGLQYLNKDHLKALAPQKLSLNHPLQLKLSENDPSVLKSRIEADGIAPKQQDMAKFDFSIESNIDRMLDIRMLFSALVDADFLDTEAHFNGDEKGKRYRESGPALKTEQTLEILLTYIEQVRQKTTASADVVEVRTALLADCLRATDSRTSLFTITAPTGSGKTFAMLAFALKHALEKGLRRVVMVIPYLSIIEQTAAIYRNILAPHFGENYVLEHHSLAGFGAEPDKNISDNEGENGEKTTSERQRRLLSENWDAPIIVTTSVQMLESLFSNRSSACRKLHQLARSVILFDEVQTLPAGFAVPTLAALSHLANGYGSSIVFATATQPAFEHLDNAVKTHCNRGWRPSEIVSQPASLFKRLRRTKVTWDSPDHGIGWDELTERLRKNKQALCIVNLKGHARSLWECLGEGTFHLSTNMCPAHRRDILDSVRNKLNEKQPVCLVATQCVEAGVDVDFPVVYRAYAPLDSVIQAAGRCNREGRLEDQGLLYVFMPEDEAYPPGGGYEQAAHITKMLFREVGADNMSLDDPGFIKDYYGRLYDISKPEMSKGTKELMEFVKAGSFPDVARQYRLIKQDAINVLVPYASMMTEFERLNDEADKTGLTAAWIKDARLLAVSLYRPKPDDAVWDALIPVKTGGRKVRGEGDWFIYAVKEHYHSELGLVPSGALNIWIG
ncbi:MAG: CRISPR-associated helicase Cas3' [Thermodesulfobacteriota bacterium]